METQLAAKCMEQCAAAIATTLDCIGGFTGVSAINGMASAEPEFAFALVRTIV